MHPSNPSPSSSSSASTILGLPKLPARYAGIVMPFFLSLLMTCIVSMISTLKGVGWGPAFLKVWPGAWGMSWVVAFPALLLLLPVVRRLTMAIVRAD